MHAAIKKMLARYPCHSEQDYLNAIKEIFQEIALLGLWRAKFFEKAAFYGGSALRVLYGLDRFSEDLDFSLLSPAKHFDLTPYNQAIVKELLAFGFHAEMETKAKQIETHIESAFLKADSKQQLISIEAPSTAIHKIHRMQKIKIKMEVDIQPPMDFHTEVNFLLRPVAFSVRSYAKPDLFAGKIHALLCRPWVNRVKGRDWYDFAWYIGTEVPVHLAHLQRRLEQNHAWKHPKKLNKTALLKLLKDKIAATDFEAAKQDILPFIDDASKIAVWSAAFFEAIVDRICVL